MEPPAADAPAPMLPLPPPAEGPPGPPPPPAQAPPLPLQDGIHAGCRQNLDSRTIVYEVIDITVNVCGGVAVALVPLVGGLSALESIGPARYVASGVMGVTTIVWLVIYQQGKGLLQGLKRGEPPTDFFGRALVDTDAVVQRRQRREAGLGNFGNADTLAAYEVRQNQYLGKLAKKIKFRKWIQIVVTTAASTVGIVLAGIYGVGWRWMPLVAVIMWAVISLAYLWHLIVYQESDQVQDLVKTV